jgi:sortase A
VTRLLRLLQCLLLAGGLGVLLYCGFTWFGAREFQRHEEEELDQTIQEAPRQPPAVREPVRGLIGRIESKRIGLRSMIVEGSDDRTLERAAGHLPGTALPGEDGNAVIAGHRDTFFRPLKDARRGDVIRLTTPRGKYVYRVVSMTIVQPDDLRVLESDGSKELTLITCYPFRYVGAAPKRFVVRADIVK